MEGIMSKKSAQIIEIREMGEKPASSLSSRRQDESGKPAEQNGPGLVPV
jgi:hypothetical protein